jgi:D-inositol-3-phosphate glycosyltransferase
MPYEEAISYGLTICAKHEPKIIHGQHIDGALVGMSLKASFNIPLVLTIHKTPLMSSFDESLPKRKAVYSTLKHIVTSESVDRFIAGSKAFDGELRRLGAPAERIRFSYHGVQVDRLRKLANDPKQIAHLKKTINNLKGFEIVMCPSRLDRRKNLTTLVEAVARVQSNLPHRNLALLITGAGIGDKTTEENRMIQELESLAKGTAIAGKLFFQLFPFRLLPALYRSASVCVLPSRREGLGLVLLEAFSTGCPVIAANSPGINEVITKSGEQGLLFDPEDPEDLEVQIRSLLVDPALAQRLKDRGLNCVRSKFDAKGMAERHMSCYSELVN